MQSAHLGQTRGSCPQHAFSGGLSAGASLFTCRSFCSPDNALSRENVLSPQISAQLCFQPCPPSSLVGIPPPSLFIPSSMLRSSYLLASLGVLSYTYLSSFLAGMNMHKRQRPWDLGFVFVVVYDSEPRTVPGTWMEDGWVDRQMDRWMDEWVSGRTWIEVQSLAPYSKLLLSAHHRHPPLLLSQPLPSHGCDFTRQKCSTLSLEGCT